MPLLVGLSGFSRLLGVVITLAVVAAVVLIGIHFNFQSLQVNSTMVILHVAVYSIRAVKFWGHKAKPTEIQY